MSENVHAETIHFEQRESSNARQIQPGPFDSERLPTVFASEIQRFLRVANLLEREEPRVAYLCRVHAFVIAHNLDKNSNETGVRQFKTSLLCRLEQDENATKGGGIGDIRELTRVYHVYRNYFTRNNKAFDLEQSRREKLINARTIAFVVFEVLKTVTITTSNQALTEQRGIQHAIMHQPEAAIKVIRNVRGLPPGQDVKKHGAFVDLFDFLQHCFGFQQTVWQQRNRATSAVEVLRQTTTQRLSVEAMKIQQDNGGSRWFDGGSHVLDQIRLVMGWILR